MYVSAFQLAPNTSSQSMIRVSSLIFLLVTHLFSAWVDAKVDYDATKSKCSHCQTLVDNFEKGLDKSQKGNFGGGNTAWEEGALGPWKISETRLLEIIEGEGDREGVCGKDFGCANLLEDEEDAVEEWYYKKQDEIKLFDYLCVQKVKACCSSKLQFGKKCASCPGVIKDKEKACNGHGTCTGGGDRTGKGTCKCDLGYHGNECKGCTKMGYYNSNTDDSIDGAICEKCHKSCLQCTAPGSDKCFTEKCTKGYEATEVTTESTQCTDVNECLDAEKCKSNQYCQNSEGSYSCLPCDKACSTCTGRGNRKCTLCADGYTKPEESDKCTDTDECLSNPCSNTQVCNNIPGSFECNDCHRACAGCTGTGPKHCKECANGFSWDNEHQYCLVDVEEHETSTVVSPEDPSNPVDDHAELGGGDAPRDEL